MINWFKWKSIWIFVRKNETFLAIFKHFNVLFLQLLWTKQSDKKLVIWRLLFAMLAGAHLKWYLEPNSSIQKSKRNEVLFHSGGFGTSFKPKLNSILGATWSYCGVVKTDALWTLLDMVHWSRRTTGLLTASN